MTVAITDTGTQRIVEITGEQRGFDGVVQYSRIETFYGTETLQALLAVKGEPWLRDEIARAEAPDYVLEPLRRQIERFTPIAGLRLLDFGCGCGASTLCLARLGAASVIGVDPQANFVEAAALRARDSGLGTQVEFRHVPDTTRLPFADGQFDAVVMNAVLEHIPPPDRRAHLVEIWRVLASGGRLLIGETPNRLWPQDFHTTGLWGVPWLPFGLARRYAIARGRVPADASAVWLLGEGFRGVTYWEIASALEPTARCLNLSHGSDAAAHWARSMRRPHQSPRRMRIKGFLAGWHRRFEAAVLQKAAVPSTALLPEISLCYQKDPGQTAATGTRTES